MAKPGFIYDEAKGAKGGDNMPSPGSKPHKVKTAKGKKKAMPKRKGSGMK